MLRLDGYNLRGDVQSLLNHSSGITAGYFSMSIASVVVSEVDLNRSQVLALLTRLKYVSRDIKAGG